MSVAKPTLTRPESEPPKTHKTGQPEHNSFISCNKTKSTPRVQEVLFQLSDITSAAQVKI